MLSVDVDGNDYWFLKALLPARPAVVVVEYNASFGLNPVTVPYEPAFDRMAKHDSGWYHGASITALTKLCKTHGYKMSPSQPPAEMSFSYLRLRTCLN